MLVDAALTVKMSSFNVTIKINNLFDEEYYHPGAINGDVGNNFQDSNGDFNRAIGFHNSLHPQLGRHGFISVGVNF